MSTKSHIVLNSSLEIYHETNESIYSFGKFRGFNIYFLATDIIDFKISKDHLIINFSLESEAAHYFGFNIFKIWLHSINEIEYNMADKELMFIIKGDSLDRDNFNNSDFNKYNFKKNEHNGK